MKYSEPLVVQGTSEVTPRSTCTEKFNCTTGAKFSCLLEFSSIVVVRFLARLSNIITNGRKLL